MNAAAYSLLNICEDITSCDCCGKSGLKCTMELQGADGSVVYFGRDCGARALAWTASADRAEKLVRGTARMDWADLEAAWKRHLRASPAYKLTPARATVDGATIELWHTAFGVTPTGGRPWTPHRAGIRPTLNWRAVA